MPTVTRRDRLIDLACLVVIIAGIVLHLDASARLRAISAYTFRHPGPHGVRQLDMADRARYESYAGVGLAVLGCVAGAASAVAVVRRSRALT